MLAFLVLTIKFGAAAIFDGQLQVIENPAVFQESGDLLGILRQLQGQNVRTIGFHFGAFHRVVIQEDETIQAELQFLGERFQIL